MVHVSSGISNVFATYLVCDSSKPCQGEFFWGERGVEATFLNVLFQKTPKFTNRTEHEVEKKLNPCSIYIIYFIISSSLVLFQCSSVFIGRSSKL